MKPVIVSIFLITAFAIGQPTVLAQKAGKKKWEYAELWVCKINQTLVIGAEFKTDKKSVAAKDLDGLANKLGLDRKDVDSLTLINYLGSLGWEMSGAMAEGDLYTRELHWYFKRKR